MFKLICLLSLITFFKFDIAKAAEPAESVLNVSDFVKRFGGLATQEELEVYLKSLTPFDFKEVTSSYTPEQIFDLKQKFVLKVDIPPTKNIKQIGNETLDSLRRDFASYRNFLISYSHLKDTEFYQELVTKFNKAHVLFTKNVIAFYDEIKKIFDQIDSLIMKFEIKAAQFRKELNRQKELQEKFNIYKTTLMELKNRLLKISDKRVEKSDERPKVKIAFNPEKDEVKENTAFLIDKIDQYLNTIEKILSKKSFNDMESKSFSSFYDELSKSINELKTDIDNVEIEANGCCSIQ